MSAGDLNRREFLKLGGAATVAGAIGATGATRAAGAQTGLATGVFAAPPIETVRIGFVGVGLQGGGHVRNLLGIPGCRITAVCDVRAERTDWAVAEITKAGHAAPAVYNRGPRDFERLCQEEDLDLVYTATPWEWHAPVMLAAMRHGKHAATEVPAVMRMDDCWAIVEAAERYRQDWRREQVAADSPKQKERYVLGDVNTSLIKTANGKTIMVHHCTNLPRPYSRINLVQGTKGLFQGSPTDMTVYDAAALSAVIGLSAQSVAKRGQSMTFPDFTRGRWKTMPPWEIVRG